MNPKGNEAAWQFWLLNPESYHQVLIIMSDRAIPTDVRDLDGYGNHPLALLTKIISVLGLNFILKAY